eukprot:scaffold47599_cov18-Prasinocladus_malaysianus.AAC.1
MVQTYSYDYCDFTPAVSTRTSRMSAMQVRYSYPVASLESDMRDASLVARDICVTFVFTQWIKLFFKRGGLQSAGSVR